MLSAASSHPPGEAPNGCFDFRWTRSAHALHHRLRTRREWRHGRRSATTRDEYGAVRRPARGVTSTRRFRDLATDLVRFGSVFLAGTTSAGPGRRTSGRDG